MFLCLCVYVCQQDSSKSCVRILIILGQAENVTRKSWLDFGVGQNHEADTGMFLNGSFTIAE